MAIVWTLLSIAGLVVAFLGFAAFAPVGRAAILEAACDVTMCSAAGMTVAGWLVVTLPAALLFVCAVYWRRLSKAGRAALLTVTAAAGAAGLVFIPGRNKGLDELVEGPGGDQFAGGVIWALIGFGASVAVWLVLGAIADKARWGNRRFNMFAGATVVVLVLAAVPVAVSRAEPTWLRAHELFPAQLSMNGDTLTRTSAADMRGCDGVLPDDSLLNRRRCLLTVSATFTTDDSDSVATLRAVLYHENALAQQVAAAVPDKVSAVGAPPESITVVSRTHSWVLVGTAAHADGRSITSAERGWVLWPLRQVSYHFIGAQAGLFIDPDPQDEIGPRVP